MPYGYGEVGISTFIGFFAGLLIARSQTAVAVSTMSTLGILIIFVGMVSMAFNRKALTGIPGGLLSGLGLGIALYGTNPGAFGFLPQIGQSQTSP